MTGNMVNSLADLKSVFFFLAPVADFRQRMAGADRSNRADAAAETIFRLRALMGEVSSDDDDDNESDNEESSEASEHQQNGISNHL